MGPGRAGRLASVRRRRGVIDAGRPLLGYAGPCYVIFTIDVLRTTLELCMYYITLNDPLLFVPTSRC